jgi:hypothetical protein
MHRSVSFIPLRQGCRDSTPRTGERSVLGDAGALSGSFSIADPAIASELTFGVHDPLFKVITRIFDVQQDVEGEMFPGSP